MTTPFAFAVVGAGWFALAGFVVGYDGWRPRVLVYALLGLAQLVLATAR